MIALLEGTVRSITADGIILMVGGVGYDVFLGRHGFEVGDQTTLRIVEIIREDRFSLFGFLTVAEQILFIHFMDVSGVGPKLAQKIMSSAKADEIAARIEAGDVDFFSSISGIGKKTAQKIILDLKGVLVDKGGAANVADEAMDALVSLGYKKDDVASALRDLPAGLSPEQRVKLVLQELGKQKYGRG